MTQYTRNVQFEIKPGKGQEFMTTMKDEVLPLLKKQDGFRGELAMVNDDRAVGISLWDNREHAEEYRTKTYPKVLETLKSVIQGTPSVENFDLAAMSIRS